MATRNDSRGARTIVRPGGNRPRTHPSPRPRHAPVREPAVTKPDLYEVLDHLSKALAIVETVARALEAAENDSARPKVGAEVATLRHGVNALRAVHQELDLAIPEHSS